MPKDFVEHGLNVIVKRLTGISHFFSKHEMDCNAMGIYFGDKTDKGVQRQRIRAEKKVTFLCVNLRKTKTNFCFRLFDI